MPDLSFVTSPGYHKKIVAYFLTLVYWLRVEEALKCSGVQQKKRFSSGVWRYAGLSYTPSIMNSLPLVVTEASNNQCLDLQHVSSLSFTCMCNAARG